METSVSEFIVPIKRYIPTLLELAKQKIKHSNISDICNPLRTSTLSNHLPGIVDKLVDVLKYKMKRLDFFYKKSTSRDRARVFSEFGAFIQVMWELKKPELFELLQVPAKKEKSLGKGQESNPEEIMQYLELKTHVKQIDSKKTHSVFVGKRNNGYQYITVTENDRMTMDAYMKMCPAAMDVQDWIFRGLRFHYIEREDVHNSKFSRFIQDTESLRDMAEKRTRNTEDVNPNFVFFHDDLKIWTTYNICRIVGQHFNKFFKPGFVSNIQCSSYGTTFNPKLHRNHCIKCINELSEKEICTETPEIIECYHESLMSYFNSYDLEAFGKAIEIAQEYLYKRGELDLSPLYDDERSKPQVKIVQSKDAKMVCPDVTEEQLAQAEAFRKEQEEKVRQAREKKRKEEERKKKEAEKTAKTKGKKK